MYFLLLYLMYLYTIFLLKMCINKKKGDKKKGACLVKIEFLKENLIFLPKLFILKKSFFLSSPSI